MSDQKRRTSVLIMVSSDLDFEILLDQYDEDPRNCSRALRTFALEQPHAFGQSALSAIGTRPVSRPIKFLVALAFESGVAVRSLLDLYGRSKELALAAAHRITECDGQLSLRLVTLLTSPESEKLPDSDFLSGLDLLNEISEGDCFVSSVLKLLKHGSPNVRSKAARFIGSRTQNLAWASNGSGEDDARVRANIIESLYYAGNDQVAHIFHKSIHDSNNRVVGNALLGLYQLHDTSAIPLIYAMAQRPEANFRNTAAWLMGHVADSRFSGSLVELMRDSDEVVRKQAFKSLGEMKRALKAAAARPCLRIGSIQAHADHPGEQHLRVTVHEDEGRIVRRSPGTGFLLKTGPDAAIVRDYSVQEYEATGSLRILFLLCLPVEGRNEMAQHWAATLESCASLRRSKDRWEAVWFKAQRPSAPNAEHSSMPLGTDMEEGSPKDGTRHRMSILNVNYVRSSAAVTPVPSSVNATELPTWEGTALLSHRAGMAGDDPNRSAERHALTTLLESEPLAGKWHLIVLGAAATNPQSIIDIFRNVPNPPARLHVITNGHSPWNGPECQEWSERSGGTHTVMEESETTAQACFSLCSSLLHHYAVKWKGVAQRPVTVELTTETGRGSTTLP